MRWVHFKLINFYLIIKAKYILYKYYEINYFYIKTTSFCRVIILCVKLFSKNSSQFIARNVIQLSHIIYIY